MKLPDWTQKELKLPKRSKKAPKIDSATQKAPKVRSGLKAPKLSRPKLTGPKAGLKAPKVNLRKPKVSIRRPKVNLRKPETGIDTPKASAPKPKASLRKPKTSLRMPKTKLRAPKTKLKAPKALEGIKAPAALAILWRQLREQHLLPVVGILLVGLVAIPILLGSSSKEEATAIAAPNPEASASAEQSALVVHKWNPGLLDYRRRLGHLNPTDPFESKAPVASEEGSESTGGEGGESAPIGESETAPETPFGGGGQEAPETQPTNPEGGGKEDEQEQGQGEPEKEQSSSTAIDVRITAVHAPGTKTPAKTQYVGHQLPQLTKLPNENVAAFTYIGPSRDGKKAMLSISPEVSALLGASKCVSGSNPCQVLALEIGAPETFVYGPKGLTYRIELLRIGPESPGALNGAAESAIGVGPAQRLSTPSLAEEEQTRPFKGTAYWLRATDH